MLVLQRKRTCGSGDSERVSRQVSVAGRAQQPWDGRKEGFIHDLNCQLGDWVAVGSNILGNIGSAGKPVQEIVIVPSEWEGKRLYCVYDIK